MGEVSYEPVIRDMTWSFSRIKAFDCCAYRWYLHYLRGLKGKELFFSSYGVFMHSLLERFYSGRASPQQLQETYLTKFRENVAGRAPNYSVFHNYFNDGLQYLKTLSSLPYNKIETEKRVNFQVNGIPFTGYIDFLGEKDGGFYIVDHKSRKLKPRSHRKVPTKADEELDEYLIQLYLYAAAVEQEYGKLPKALCFNCFRVPALIEEPFSTEVYDSAKRWLSDKVSEITVETDFRPDIEFFKCTHLCEMQDDCEYYELSRRKR